MLVDDGAVRAAPDLGPARAALSTLQRGANFIANGLSPCDRPSQTGPISPRVLGNVLEELDGFLHVLLDEAAVARSITVAWRRRHTASKLGRVLNRVGVVSPDERRLAALTRTRSCLRYHNGIARYPEARGGSTMTLGWPDHPRHGDELRVVALGVSICPSPGDLINTAMFYTGVGRRVLASLEGVRPAPDWS